VERESGTCGMIQPVGTAAVCDGDVLENKTGKGDCGATRVLVGQTWWVGEYWK
jgi:hypothetical protein